LILSKNKILRQANSLGHTVVKEGFQISSSFERFFLFQKASMGLAVAPSDTVCEKSQPSKVSSEVGSILFFICPPICIVTACQKFSFPFSRSGENRLLSR